jgi:HSP20 family protein
MAQTLVRYDPADQLDDFFAGFFRPVTGNGRGTAATNDIRIDVHEDEKSYSVEAVVPGVKKEDINVDIDGNEVSISAEVKNQKEAKDGQRVLRTERFYGKTSRRFALAHEIDEAAAEARYEDGVLKLHLPKKATSNVRKLTIQ